MVAQFDAIKSSFNWLGAKMNPKIITLGICAGAAVAAFVFLKTGAPEHTAAIPVVAGDAMVAVQIPPL